MAGARDRAPAAVSLEQNLFGRLLREAKDAFRGGANGELRSKMGAAYSSSALAGNIFSP
jgi:hypothetical protein